MAAFFIIKLQGINGWTKIKKPYGKKNRKAVRSDL